MWSRQDIPAPAISTLSAMVTRNQSIGWPFVSQYISYNDRMSTILLVSRAVCDRYHLTNARIGDRLQADSHSFNED